MKYTLYQQKKAAKKLPDVLLKVFLLKSKVVFEVVLVIFIIE